MPLTTGQILPEHKFGQVLTQLARRSDRILEIGFGSGLGSTQCLLAGMERKEQVLEVIEADPQQFRVGVVNIEATKANRRVYYYQGVLHHLFRPYYHPVGSAAHKVEYDECVRTAKTSPLIGGFVTPLDLVLLDGGEYSTDADFLMLWPTTKVFALDDCAEGVATKNVYARKCLLNAGWKVIAEDLNDRNGWGAYERPA